MDFKQLQSFITVAQSGSFSKTAEQLGLSQPTVTTHIRMLEEELGAPLVIRSSKQVTLTSQGQKIFDQAVSILSLRDRILDSSRNRDSNTIYLGASSIPSAYVLPGILAKYGPQHPEVRFVIDQSDSQNVVQGLAEDRFDIGLIGMQADEDGIQCIPFTSDHLVLATPTDKRFENLPDTVETIRNILKTENVVLRREGSGSQSTADSILEGLGLNEQDLHVVARANDQETLKNLVESGYGVTLVSYRAVEQNVRDGRMFEFEIPNGLGARNLYVAYRQRSLSANEQDFLAFLRTEYAQA